MWNSWGAGQEIMSHLCHLIATYLQVCTLSWGRPVQNREEVTEHSMAASLRSILKIGSSYQPPLPFNHHCHTKQIDLSHSALSVHMSDRHELVKIAHVKRHCLTWANAHLSKASVTYLDWGLPLSKSLPLVDYSLQFKIATWFWQRMLADKAVNFSLGHSPGLQIPPPWWECREKRVSVCVRKCACAHTQFRLMHSHVGNGRGEKGHR